MTDYAADPEIRTDVDQLVQGSRGACSARASYRPGLPGVSGYPVAAPTGIVLHPLLRPSEHPARAVPSGSQR